MGRILEPWRALLAVAHWLQTTGVEGLYTRMLTLAQAYQTERRELEPPDLTAWTIQATGRVLHQVHTTPTPDADDELFAAASSASSASGAPSVDERAGLEIHHRNDY